MKTEIQADKEYTFEWSFYDKDIKKIPISGTITVTKPGGSSLVSQTAVAIETDGTIKYTLAAANTSTVDENYRIELTYQVGDEVFRPFYLFDIVETPLINTVRDEDLFIYLPELRTQVLGRTIETTSLGSTTALVSSELSATNIDYKGGYGEVYITDTTTHSFQVTAYDMTSGTATISPAYTSAIASGLKVDIKPSFQFAIDEAYNNIVSKAIRNRVGVKARYIDTEITRNMTIFKALEIISFSKVESPDDKWDMRSIKFEKKYNDEYGKLNEPSDINDDGYIDSYEDANRKNTLNRGARR